MSGEKAAAHRGGGAGVTGPATDSTAERSHVSGNAITILAGVGDRADARDTAGRR
jgi:hypothetical protein